MHAPSVLPEVTEAKPHRTKPQARSAITGLAAQANSCILRRVGIQNTSFTRFTDKALPRFTPLLAFLAVLVLNPRLSFIRVFLHAAHLRVRHF